ncbi:MAG: Asp-tRNA(Asn)/Glu-tRNA(Gln) amidotransferase subunit GatB [Deltaproteobacteria bacterium]|nr:Asp-tRNA(Asn)/Glu-tRNA(Gln) amidotransferase subunit GatB [Deltaproteobacteria bacterium]
MTRADFEAVIGLEVHAQLLTASKLFCGCSTTFGAPPNHHTCPVCLGLPGALPVLSRRAVEFAIRLGLAVGCTIRKKNRFARKNYFYPDLPKGYQISQYEEPICEGGRLDVAGKVVRLRRIHMEEDAGKCVHDAAGSSVDLNRAGVPLLEIVSEPDLSTPEEAGVYLRALRDIVVYLGVCDGNMEEGSFRCDANVSVRRAGARELGTRAEIKNVNSFRFVEKAIAYEIARQVDVVLSGGSVVQETRLFDSDRGITQSMRGKEEAHDYRYFPDPDLLPLDIADASIDDVRRTLPELPAARRSRFLVEYGISEADAVVLTADRVVAEFFDVVMRAYAGDGRRAAGFLRTDWLRVANDRGAADVVARVPAAKIAQLLQMVDAGTISIAARREVFALLVDAGEGDPEAIVRERGLAQTSDAGAIEAAVDAVLSANPNEVAAYRAGKEKLLSFFVGQVMKATRGKANPAIVNDLVLKRLRS